MRALFSLRGYSTTSRTVFPGNNPLYIDYVFTKYEVLCLQSPEDCIVERSSKDGACSKDIGVFLSRCIGSIGPPLLLEQIYPLLLSSGLPVWFDRWYWNDDSENYPYRHYSPSLPRLREIS